ncbi:MAG: rfbC [Crocinitomicaceae bacterium]|nr:rfbC [Crocinitomicaceae bacterium]
MNALKTEIEGVYVIEPQVFGDARGYFFESYNKEEFTEKVGPLSFIQDNESLSSYGVLRGLHFQKPPFDQAKLVRVIKGEILDVALDIRKGSPTYGKHVARVLSGENKLQLFVPSGFAHGFAVLSEEAVVAYKVDKAYRPDAESGVMWNDPALGIDWMIDAEKVKLSAKDGILPLLKDLESPF